MTTAVSRASSSPPRSSLVPAIFTVIGGLFFCACANRVPVESHAPKQKAVEDPSNPAAVATTNQPATKQPGSSDGNFADEPAIVDQDISPAQAKANIPYRRFAIPVGDSPSQGPRNAPITILMFSDFECPYCRKGHEILNALERKYPGKIRRVYKSFPLSGHRAAMYAALIALSAESQEKFWSFHRKLYSGYEITPQSLSMFVEEVGMDRSKVEQDLDTLVYAPKIQRDLRLARKMGVSSTPTFFINGRRIKGAVPLEVFSHMIDQELRFLADSKLTGPNSTGNNQNIYRYLTQHGFTGVAVPEQEQGLNPDTRYPIPIEGAPQRGSSGAAITVVSFADFECPYCAHGDATLQALQRRYGNEIRFIYRHLPLSFHKLGQKAARLAVLAQDKGKFWELHDRIYQQAREGLSETQLREAARKLRLPPKEVDKALSEEPSRYADRVAQDLEIAQQWGIRGTPTYFINGRAMTGAQSEIRLRFVIAEELEVVKGLREQGVRGDDLYNAMLKSGL